MIKESIAETLKFCRKEAGMSYRTLSEKIGVSNVMIVYYENKKSLPSEETLKKICDVFKLDYKSMYLLKLTEQASDKTKAYLDISQPAYPNLRDLLLHHYSVKIFLDDETKKECATDDLIKKILHQYPLHPIERTLLQVSYNNLGNLQGAKLDPIEYFNTLNDDGKQQKLKDTELQWAYNVDYKLIAIKVRGINLFWKSAEQVDIPYLNSLFRLRKILLSLYKTYGQEYVSDERIGILIFTDFSHQIEGKLLAELNKRLPKNLRIDASFKSFFPADPDLKDRFKKANLIGWGFRRKDNLLTVEFKNCKPVNFKLEWKDIEKRK